MGDFLVVALTSDKSVGKEKGEGRPLFRQEQRAELLGSLRHVDSVVIVDNVMQALKTVRPNVFVKGRDYSEETIDPQISTWCKRHRVAIAFTASKKWSATEIGHVLRRS